MKTKFLFCLVFVLLALSVSARAVRLWTEKELEAASDLVVAATPITSRDLDETNSLGWEKSIGWYPGMFRGVETTFHVLDVLKGTPANDRITLHHYRIEKVSPPNGPMFVEFPANDTTQYVLYLVKEDERRYAPAAGQVDSMISVRPVTNTNVMQRIGFPVLPPIADANPAIRYPISVRIPTRLVIERTTDTLSAALDTNSFISTNLTIGSNMVAGVEIKKFVYPQGEPRPENGSTMGRGGIVAFDSERSIWNTKTEGIPLAGKSYEIEYVLTVFETDIPPQHMWSPNGKNYQVLWRQILKGTARALR